MPTGHNSHQVGLDADIWFTPMPDRKLSREERECMSAVDMVAGETTGSTSIPNVWTHERTELIRTAARGSRGRAHLRQCRDQEGAVPRGRH